MMYESIKNFHKQFEYQPTIKNSEKLVHKDRVIVAGMGGSELAAMLMKDSHPEIDFIIHKNYGLPQLGDAKLKESLVIVSSYSGNTEEAIDAFETAFSLGLPLAVSTTGGRLLELAKKNTIPYVQIPNSEIQPRTALGYSTLALLKILGKEYLIDEIKKLSSTLSPLDYEEEGKDLAKKIIGKTPLVYSSKIHQSLAYVWKIKFNETGKIPAFYNVFPELNHNEIEGFSDGEEGDISGVISHHLGNHYACILLKDTTDHPRIIRRMEILSKLYRERGIDVYEIVLEGASNPFKIFSSVVLADWTSYYVAEAHGVDPERVSMIEEFKRLI